MAPELKDLRRVGTNWEIKELARKGTRVGKAKIASRTPFLDDIVYKKALKSINERKKHEKGLEDFLDTILELHPGKPYEIEAKQFRDEIKSLAKLVEDEEPDKIMEIGTLWGGTFYLWERYIDSADDVISLDLPGGPVKRRRDQLLRDMTDEKNIQLFRGNSHSEDMSRKVKKNVGEVDFLFIDGDHSYEGVKQDFEMYKELVRNGGIIAFHDIVPRRKQKRVQRSGEKLNCQ